VFVALGTQRAMRICHIVIYGLSGSTIFFPHYFINDTIFRKILPNTKCVFSVYLQLLSEASLSLRRTERDVIKHIYIYIYIYRVFHDFRA